MKNWMRHLKTLRSPIDRRDDGSRPVRPAKTAPRHHVPYDAGMTDRFYADLSTR